MPGDMSTWQTGQVGMNQQCHIQTSYNSSTKAIGRHTQMWRQPRTINTQKNFLKKIPHNEIHRNKNKNRNKVQSKKEVLAEGLRKSTESF